MKLFRMLSVLAALLGAHAAHAQVPRAAEIVQAEMRSGWLAENGAHLAAVQLRLAPGWMTYWRHPGESGLVPQLDWSGAQNVAQARIIWPEPRLYIKAGFASIGYTGDVILPLEITPQDPSRPVEFSATLSLGVCEDVCIPVDLGLHTVLNGRGMHDHDIAAALDRRPSAARAAGLHHVACSLTAEGRALRLSAQMQMPRRGIQEFLLIELPGQPLRALPSERIGDTLVGHSLMRVSGSPAIDRSAVRLSVVSERGTVVHQGCAMSD